MKTVDELAAELQVHRITIYRLLKGGRIPGFKIGRVWRFHAEEVRRWIEQAGAEAQKEVPTGK
jgi:excisionase family DNA binding protein